MTNNTIKLTEQNAVKPQKLHSLYNNTTISMIRIAKPMA